MHIQNTEHSKLLSTQDKVRCARCVYDIDVPAINFDSQGVCNYCIVNDQLEKEYPVGEEGERILRKIADDIHRAGKGKKYDCVVGVSGGCDSSFLLYKMKELGLRPLAAHFDNTWNSTTATENIQAVLGKLGIDLYTIVVDNSEYDDIYRSFFKAGVPDIEAPTDIGLAVTLYRAAEKIDIKYIIEGHSFRTEGISPLGWIYMDGKYISSVQKKFGTVPLKTYPNMPLYSFIKWMCFKGIRKIRPLYYIDYHKENAKKLLTEKFGWQWYGGHHLENRFTAFFHTYFWPKRFGFDGRMLEYAALTRSGQMQRDEGIELLSQPYPYDKELVELVKKRLGFSDDEFNYYMTMPKKTYRDYTTYKKTFESLRPFFWLMYRLNMAPKSFYMKYCFPD